MLSIPLILFLSIVSAILYRAGGMSQDTKHWIPKWLRHSWVRDWLCPICALLPLVLVYPSWLFILAYLALAGCLTTYWDFLFGFDNFWFSGFMCGVAAFMLIWVGLTWWLILIRAIALALLWGGICAVSSNDFVEEYSRGFTLSFATIIFI